MRYFFVIFFAFLSPLIAEEAELSKNDSNNTEASSTQKNDEPAIVRLPDGMMKIGEVTFDPKNRQIRVPCTINTLDELLEFALVHENGKIHESLLATSASPLHIHIAMKMLRYTASEELYFIEKEKGVSSGKFPEVAQEIRNAARIQLSLEFVKEEKSFKLPIRDLIVNTVTETTMPEEDWIFGGSFMSDGKFYAETSGEIACIFVSRGSLMLFAGKENQNDEVWIANTKRLPAVGSKATFIIEPKEFPKIDTKKP